MTMQMELNFDAARARGSLGAERAAGKAERAAPGWVDLAAEGLRSFVRHNLRGMTRPFTVEVAREWVMNTTTLPEPPDARAWGHVTRRAVALGYITRVPGQFAPAASSNGSPKPLYVKGRNA